MSRPSLVKEFFLFIRREKKWWMIPLIFVLLIVGTVIFLAEVYPAIAPFFYTLH